MDGTGGLTAAWTLFSFSPNWKLRREHWVYGRWFFYSFSINEWQSMEDYGENKRGVAHPLNLD